MPSGTGRGIALGIEQGAQNFLNSYLQVKQAKHEEKYRKLAPIIQVVYSQIQDPNVPLDQKIKAMDSLPHILGTKADVPLSVTLGLDKLAQEQIDTGETETVKGRASETITDPNAVELNRRLKTGVQLGTSGMNEDGTIPETESEIATNIQTKPTQDITKPLMRRRGELSATDIQIAKQLKIHQAQAEDDFRKQYRVELVRAKLQENVLNRQGWKNNGDWTYDAESKTWQQEWFNPITKETYQQKLEPGIVPESVILKQIQASGKGSGGVSKAYSTLRTAIATQLGLEEDDPKVQLRTAELWKDNFEATVQFKKQGVSGTREIQPAQKEGLGLSKLAAQQKHAEIVAAAAATESAIPELERIKNQAWQASADAKADFDRVKKDYDPDESEYQSAQAAYNKAFDDARNANAAWQEALKAKDKLKEQVKLSEGAMGKAGLDTSNAAAIEEFSPRMKVAIAAVRKANPNTKLTDKQIAARIRAEKGIE